MARYFRRGVSEVWFTTALSSQSSPSKAQYEGASGDDLTGSISDMSGWEFNNSPIATPKLSTTFTTTIVGEDTAGGPEVVLYDDDAATTLRDAMAKGTTGFIVLCPTGSTASEGARVFPVTSTGVNDSWTLGNEAAKFTIQFAVTAVPTLTATIAA